MFIANLFLIRLRHNFFSQIKALNERYMMVNFEKQSFYSFLKDP